MALSISITTRMLRETVEAVRAESLENMLQPISGKVVVQRWKWVCQLVSMLAVQEKKGRWSHELPEADLRPILEEHEPPSVAANGREADVGADHHVAEEEPATDQRLVPLTWRPLHDIVIRRVEAERSGWKPVGDQVDPQKLDGDERLRHAERSRQEDGHDFADVGRDQVADELLGVVVDAAAFLDRAFDGGEVVVGEDHVRGELGDVCAGAHCHADVRLLEGRRVIDTVAGHGDDLTGGLQEID